MSEQCALYIKVHIQQPKLQQFFLDKPSPAVLDTNWAEWWDAQEMYSKQELKQIPCYTSENNRAIIDIFLNDQRLGAQEHYDAQHAIWYFCIAFFSENYEEILPMLAWLKNLANYQDPEEKGVALIYDHHWGDDFVMAYMDFHKQEALLRNLTNTADIPPVILHEAEKRLSELVDALRRRYED